MKSIVAHPSTGPTLQFRSAVDSGVDWRLAAIREEFDAGRADESETSAAIRAAWREAGDLVDPYTGPNIEMIK